MLKIGSARKKQIEIPFWTRFWGHKCKVKPVFIPAVFGNGEILLAVSPLNTRPNFYLVRVDSSWELSGWGRSETIRDHIDDIYEAIEETVGQGGQLDKEESPTGRARYFGWPALNDDAGSSWWDASSMLRKVRS